VDLHCHLLLGMILLYLHLICGTEQPVMCWCAIKKLLSRSLTVFAADIAEMLSEAVKILKGEYCLRAIRVHNMDKAIIFCRTKVDCDNMESYLNKAAGGNTLLYSLRIWLSIVLSSTLCTLCVTVCLIALYKYSYWTELNWMFENISLILPTLPISAVY